MIARTNFFDNPVLSGIVVAFVAVFGIVVKNAFWDANEAVHRNVICDEQFQGKAADECADRITEVTKTCDSINDGGSSPEQRRKFEQCKQRGREQVLRSVRKKYPELVVGASGSSASPHTGRPRRGQQPKPGGSQQGSRPAPTNDQTGTPENAPDQGPRKKQRTPKKGVQPDRPFKPSRPVEPANPIDK